MTFKQWDERTFQEKAAGWPDWHPYPVKCLLTVVLEYGIDFSVVEAIAKAMGWLRMSVADEVEFPLGEDRTVKANLVKYGWVNVNDAEASKDED